MLAGCREAIPPSTTLRIGVFEVQDLLPYYVMQEEGLDVRQGLHFVEHSFAGGAAALQAMAEGWLDVCPAVGVVPFLTAAERGLVPGKVVLVAANDLADREHPGVALLVSHSIQGWKDLNGQKIAVNARDSVTAAAVDVRFREEGVVGHSFVTIPFSNMGLAVAGGNVAAAGMNEPYFTQSVLRRDGRLLDWVVGGRPFDRTQPTGIVFRTDLYQSNPGSGKAYLRAHLAAVRWINDNPEKARRLLAKRLSLSAEVSKGIHLLRWPLELTLHVFQAHKLTNRIHVVRDGAEALDFIFCAGRYASRNRLDRPKVILLDLKLPRIDGLEVLGRVKRDDATRVIPVVVMTSSREERDLVESYRLGVNSYIVKPVDFQQFSEAVRQVGLYWVLLNQPPVV